MQNNENYFEVTIRNKYDTWAAKRKEMKKKILLTTTAIVLFCGSMIFSKNVSSLSEVASEDIRESEIFPTSRPSAYEMVTENLPKEPIAEEPVPLSSTTQRLDKMVDGGKKYMPKPTSEKIVSVTDKSSENQNDTLLTSTEVTTSGEKDIQMSDNEVSLTPSSSFEESSSFSENPVEEYSVEITSSLVSQDLNQGAVTQSAITTSAIDVIQEEAEEFLEMEAELKRQEKEKERERKEKERRRRERLQRKRNWKHGGNAGKSNTFDHVNNDDSQYKKAKSVFKHLKSAGYTDAAAAGVLGNIEQESSFNTRSVTGRYRGLFQLSIYDRFGNSTEWCNNRGYSPYSIEGQVRFMLEEMVDDQARKGLFEYFTGYSKSDYPGIKDPEEAAYVFCAGYEGAISGGSGRSATWQELSKRQAYARKWYNEFKGLK